MVTGFSAGAGSKMANKLKVKAELNNMAEKPEDKAVMRWYIVHVYSGYELKFREMLAQKITGTSLSERFGEVLIPTEEVVEMRAGKKRRSERKFFPGYVLVHMIMDDETWYLVRKMPRVLGFIGGQSGHPVPITDAEADNILRRVQDSSDKPKPKVLFEPGEVVRVTDGPFADFTGNVEEVNYEKNRMRVAVLIFGRATPVDLDFSQVEKS